MKHKSIRKTVKPLEGIVNFTQWMQYIKKENDKSKNLKDAK